MLHQVTRHAVELISGTSSLSSALGHPMLRTTLVQLVRLLFGKLGSISGEAQLQDQLRYDLALAGSGLRGAAVTSGEMHERC